MHRRKKASRTSPRVKPAVAGVEVNPTDPMGSVTEVDTSEGPACNAGRDEVTAGPFWSTRGTGGGAHNVVSWTVTRFCVERAACTVACTLATEEEEEEEALNVLRTRCRSDCIASPSSS